MTQTNSWMILPFVLLLTLMALAPLFFAKWWARHFAKVVFGLALLPLAYYWFGLQAEGRVSQAAFDYLRFIVLIGSLFVVSGGSHITVKGEATPLANVVFLLVVAVLSNFRGTSC